MRGERFCICKPTKMQIIESCALCHISEFKIMLLTFSTDIMLDKKGLHIVGLNTLTKLKALSELFLSNS